MTCCYPSRIKSELIEYLNMSGMHYVMPHFAHCYVDRILKNNYDVVYITETNLGYACKETVPYKLTFNKELSELLFAICFSIDTDKTGKIIPGITPWIYIKSICAKYDHLVYSKENHTIYREDQTLEKYLETIETFRKNKQIKN